MLFLLLKKVLILAGDFNERFLFLRKYAILFLFGTINGEEKKCG